MYINIRLHSFAFSTTRLILENIDVDVEKGQTLAIVGASGCGKSTLLRILSGILPNTHDGILDGNITIDKKEPKEFRQTGKLAFMFQEATLLPHKTVRENISLPLSIQNLPAENIVDELLGVVGLKQYGNYMPKELSGGMKTRVALARSFASSPELLLLDEPFSALDIAWKSKLYIELEKLRAKTKTTTIVVTHDVQEALLLADTVVVLNNKGMIEKKADISTSFSIGERVEKITEYMNSVYESYMLPIQEAIINGQRATQ
jgi:NitT/TauT family transport system ATP-binding protein